MSEAHDAGGGSWERWLRYAEEDVSAAETLLLASSARVACFLAQQAAEKALKALLVFSGIDAPKTHSLNALRNLLPKDLDSVHELGDLSELSAWAIMARYPADWPEPTAADAQAAIGSARQVLAVARRDLLGTEKGDHGD